MSSPRTAPPAVHHQKSCLRAENKSVGVTDVLELPAATPVVMPQTTHTTVEQLEQLRAADAPMEFASGWIRKKLLSQPSFVVKEELKLCKVRGRPRNHSCPYAPTITFVTAVQSLFASPASQKLMRYSRISGVFATSMRIEALELRYTVTCRMEVGKLEKWKDRRDRHVPDSVQDERPLPAQ